MHQKPLHLCFIALKKMGGAETQLIRLAEFLAEDPDFKISVISEDYQNPMVFRIISPKTNHPFAWLSFCKNAFALFRKINPDVVVNSGMGFLGFTAFLYCRVFGKKRIERASTSAQRLKEMKKQKWLRCLLYVWQLRHANFFLAQNAISQREFWEKLHLYAHFILPSISPEIPHLHEKIYSHILWVGRSHSVKRPELFLELAKQFPEEKFVMVIAPDHENLLRDLQEQAKLIPNLTLIPGLTPEQLLELYRTAKILINTSTFEGFPNTFLEAAVHKTPIISFSIDPGAFLEKSGGGFFCNNDFSKLIESVSQLLKNSDEIKRRGESAFQHIKKFHRKEAVGSLFKALIRVLHPKKFEEERQYAAIVYALHELQYYSPLFDDWNIDCKGKTVLDLAAGPGQFLAETGIRGAKKLFWQDISPTCQELAKQYLKGMGVSDISFSVADLNALPYPENSFDLVICRAALFHSHQEYDVLKKIHRILKPQGLFYLQTPSAVRVISEHPRPHWKKIPRLLVGYAGLIANFFGFQKPIRSSFSSPIFLRHWIQSLGFQILREETSMINYHCLIKK